MQRDEWIDRFTAAVTLQFLVFDGEVGLFCRVMITFEFSEAGGVEPSVYLDTSDVESVHLTSLLFFTGTVLLARGHGVPGPKEGEGRPPRLGEVLHHGQVEGLRLHDPPPLAGDRGL